jgi:hypothetical protein
MKYRPILQMGFSLLAIVGQQVSAKTEPTTDEILRALESQEARLKDLDIHYTVTSVPLKVGNFVTKGNKDVFQGWSDLSPDQMQARTVVSSYHEFLKGERAFLEEHEVDGRPGTTSLSQFSRDSDGITRALDNASKTGTIRQTDKRLRFKMRKSAVTFTSFFREVRETPIILSIGNGAINDAYPEKTVNGVDCVVVELSYYLSTVNRDVVSKRFWLDPTKDYVPLRMAHYYPSGEIIEQIDTLEYIDIDGIWLPLKGVRHDYAVCPDGRNVMTNTQTLDVDQSDIRVNKGIPDDKLTVDFPVGTFVWDGVAKTTYVVQGAQNNEQSASGSPKHPRIYDPNADAEKQISDALGKAKRDNKHVLLMYGGNWCRFCHVLFDCFNKDGKVSKLFRDKYELVLVDIESNEDLPRRFGAKPEGYPYLTILNGEGGVVVNHSTGSFSGGMGYDPNKVFAFLYRWKPKP